MVSKAKYDPKRSRISCSQRSSSKKTKFKSGNPKQPSRKKVSQDSVPNRNTSSEVRTSYLLVALSSSDKDGGWIFDSVATTHFCRDKDLFSKFEPVNNQTLVGAVDNITTPIKVAMVNKGTVLQDAMVENVENFDFCVCNPPFFENKDDMRKKSPRMREKLELFAKKDEIFSDGGEVSFVKQLLKDSLMLKDRISLYSSMFGKKKSFLEILKELQSVEGISYTKTEFCQGNTIRWGIAWTFLKDVNFEKIERPKPKKPKKAKPPLVHSISRKLKDCNILTLQEILESIKSTLCEFQAHSSADCFSAQKMSLADRLNILKEKNCCFACLNVCHSLFKCRIFLKCVVCGKKHVPLMCEAVESQKHESKKAEEKEAANEINMSNISLGPKVFLQTLTVKMISDKKEVSVRIILDSGSRRSYTLKSLAEEMGYIPVRKETLVHLLFGGVKSEKFEHTCYQIRLRSLENNFTCNFEALEQLTICNDVTPVNAGPWMKKLQEMNITLADVGEKSQPVQVLIGADLFGKFLTGQRRVLSCGLVAIETLSGKVPENRVTSSNAILVTSIFVKEFDISDLWKLDLIGIKDPIEKLSKKEQEDLTKEHFLQTVRYNDDKQYEVHLPWLDNYAPLPDNLELAIRRLESTTKKLLHENLYNAYEGIFLEWLHEGIIEEVPVDEVNLSGTTYRTDLS
ncbi:U6 small nuclear RNA (adenine-(43)-N(6))-methyltransferase [Araneus ventricosus]|uniref:U6 small nuclear RNA (Adenine-(43)-N(6))-methyltransferase n=1 Tax=Araneus ventricosus TaxID=182803 RepID=A0A4Y2HH63_ARAVE|nr:U6 small nuclear RNA (adenine-(43)-N(6))-methyltransferase [Araneus ventricosus]